MNGLEIARKAREALIEKKGEAIVILDVRSVSEITDYVVIASGGSPPQLKAMAGEVEHLLKEQDVRAHRRAGDPDCGWVVLDYLDAVVHVFERGTRRYYAIEDLWSKAKKVD